MSSIRMCYQCGICTATCPQRRVSRFSPRLIAYDYITYGKIREEIWDCLTCDACVEDCPHGVRLSDFVLDARIFLGVKREIIAHKGIFSEIAHLMTFFDKGIPTDYEGETDDKSDIGYFPGCIDYFDLFLDLDYKFHEIGNSTIELLNRSGIKPKILDLKCCGHDLLYQGDIETFEKLKKYNTKKIEESGVKKIVLSCAECYAIFKMNYKLDVEVLHISELLSENMKKFPEIKKRVTYHDPCRLGRYCGIYDEPRILIRNTGADLIEFDRSREKSQCCGISAWMNCDDRAKALRVEKLENVKKIGADVLITTCPKCIAHLNCLKEEKDSEGKYDFDITDLTVFLAGGKK
ncbi:MAG: (Fe-S)-binding protein [Candidatus Syntropharchaeia archaeon]